jgi:hypothetical protein
MTPEQLRLRAQIANAERWSRIPPGQRAAHTAAARAAIDRKYQRQVDPDRQLPEAERMELARQAMKADLARRALKASRNRSARKAAAAAADAPEEAAQDGAA